MKFRIVTGKQPESYAVEAATHEGALWKVIELGFISVDAARDAVWRLQREYAKQKLWQPGMVVEEFDDEV